LHSELPGEKHTVIAFALGVELVFEGLVPALSMTLILLRLLLEIVGSSESARYSVRLLLKLVELPLDGVMKFLKYFLFLVVGKAHLLYGQLE